MLIHSKKAIILKRVDQVKRQDHGDTRVGEALSGCSLLKRMMVGEALLEASNVDTRFIVSERSSDHKKRGQLKEGFSPAGLLRRESGY